VTEYELMDLMNGAQQAAIALGVAVVTQQVAYIVAIYFVGARLNALPLSFLIVAYSLWLLGPVYGFDLAAQRFMWLSNELSALRGEEAAFATGQHYANTVVYVVIWLLSLAYTFHVRRHTD